MIAKASLERLDNLMHKRDLRHKVDDSLLALHYQMRGSEEDLGFAGAHIGGFGLKHQDFLHIRELSEEIGSSWRNRLDEIVLFHPLLPEHIEKVVELFADELVGRLHDQGVELRLSDEARAWIAREGYDPVYGARPLRRFMQRQLETPLARLLVGGELKPGSAVTAELEGGALTLRPDQDA